MTKSIDFSLKTGDLSVLTTYQAGVLQAASNRALQRYCDKILKQFDISKMQWLVIGTIYDEGDTGARLTELAAMLDTTLPYITNMVNLLESKGILERENSTSDSRSKFIHLSAKFSKQFKKIEMVLRQSLRGTIYAGIDPDDFRTYMKVMYQLSIVDK